MKQTLKTKTTYWFQKQHPRYCWRTIEKSVQQVINNNKKSSSSSPPWSLNQSIHHHLPACVQTKAISSSVRWTSPWFANSSSADAQHFDGARYISMMQGTGQRRRVGREGKTGNDEWDNRVGENHNNKHQSISSRKIIESNQRCTEHDGDQRRRVAGRGPLEHDEERQVAERRHEQQQLRYELEPNATTTTQPRVI